MPTADKAQVVSGERGGGFLWTLGILVLVLGLLFHRSLEPGQVLFANDGPLGANMSQAESGAQNFFGQWQDLTWLGGEVVGCLLRLTDVLLVAAKPVAFAKFYVPVALLLLGLAAWLYFRQLGFSPTACVLGGLAVALNMNVFSVSCWGLANWGLARACVFLALAAWPHAGVRHSWARAALAGLAVGLALMEGFDVGAIFSLYVGAFVLYQGLTAEEGGAGARRWAVAGGRVMVVAAFAAVIAAQALTTLIGTQVKGVVGMQQDERTKEYRWMEATLWSLPRVEALRVVIPGLFGYRMPKLYGDPEDTVGGSNYWGGVGAPEGNPGGRHSGCGEFAGVLVTLVALWAAAQSFRGRHSPFAPWQRRLIWFWAGAALLSLLLAFGRHTPLYRIAYALPYFSTIRNPLKFLHPFHLAIGILFACGVEGLVRAYVQRLPERTVAWTAQLRDWWRSVRGADRWWVQGMAAAIGASGLAWIVYAGSLDELVAYLRSADFADPNLARSIAQFSLREAGWFLVFLTLSAGVLVLILGGVFAGRTARWAGVVLGGLLVLDLVRADLPWIVYYDYHYKYATNPVVERLRDNPERYRVAAKLSPMTQSYLVTEQGQLLVHLYFTEWLQHHFPFYRVPSLDIIQMSRPPEFDSACIKNFLPTGETNMYRIARLWELGSVRHVIGMAGFLPQLNTGLDPGKGRFRIETHFSIVPKAGKATAISAQDLSAALDPNGIYALFEFTGALPRARLFANWEVQTNDTVTLQRLASLEFDPHRTVLVAEPVPTPGAPAPDTVPGTVTWERSDPKQLRLRAEVTAPALLLLNDRHHPAWRVWVDGAEQPLLRCNYIMRGVRLEPGAHIVEFRFLPPRRMFYISLAGWICGVALCGVVVAASRRKNR